jgi:WD40 repeat protein
VVNNTSIYVWNTTTGHLLGQFQKDGASIRSLALSPDGARIISISFSETIVQMWHVGDDSGISFDTYSDPPESAAFFPDGVHFITMSDSGAIIWDIRSTTPWGVFKSTLRPCLWGTDIAISSDGTRLISTRYLWNITNCQVLKSFHDSAAKFSPDGTRAAIALDTGIQILDASSGATLHQSDAIASGGMSFSLDSTQLLHWTYDGIVCVMDLTCLPTSVNTEVLSCVYPPDCMMIQSFQGGGWYRATNGARLMWLPHPAWLATGGPSGFRRLILGSTNGLTILDMDDYLEVPSVGAAWRKGGTRYIQNTHGARQASALMSESGSAVRLSRLFVSFIPC